MKTSFLSKNLVIAALLVSGGVSAITAPAAQAQGVAIGMGVSLGISLLSHAARHAHNSSSSTPTPTGPNVHIGGANFFGTTNRSNDAAAYAVYNKAVKSYNKGEFEETAARCQNAIALKPSLGDAHALLAVCMTKQGNFTEAMEEFKLAEKHNSGRNSVDYERGICATSLKDFDAAQKSFQLAVARDHSASREESAKRALEIISHNFVCPSDGDYVTDATQEGARRWADASQPLRVFVEPNSTADGYRSEFAKELKEAFADWSNVTNNQVKFVFTDNADDAQIKCSWTGNQMELGGTKELGITMVKYSDGVIQSAEIKLLTLKGIYPDNSPNLLPQAKCVALHEIGHALGLQHSGSSFDTMFPTAPPCGMEFALTQRDANTVMTLYKQAKIENRSGRIGESREAARQ